MSVSLKVVSMTNSEAVLWLHCQSHSYFLQASKATLNRN